MSAPNSNAPNSSAVAAVLKDLRAEGAHLDSVVGEASEEQWRTPTPAEGWDVATTIAHLAWTDQVALLAVGAHTEQGKRAWDDVVLEAIADPTGYVDAQALALGASEPATELLARWRAGRSALAGALLAHPHGTRIPWFGPPMSPTSMATARFMETWAHGLDVQAAFGLTPEPTDRVRHVVHLGVRTRGFSFATNELEMPPHEVRVDLVAPSGDVWSWGPEDAPETVTGSAWDFARLVTQRVHRDDTDLVAHGAGADTWLCVAQAFAGPAGGGRSRQPEHPSTTPQERS